MIFSDTEELDDSCLDAVVESHGFIRYERQKRKSGSNIKKDHYKVNYKPVFQTYTDEDYILLDVLYESFQKYRLPEDFKDVMIEDPSINKLNRLKKVNPEAFYYWYLISKMQVQDEED